MLHDARISWIAHRRGGATIAKTTLTVAALLALAACGGGGDDLATEQIAAASKRAVAAPSSTSTITTSAPTSTGGVTPVIVPGANNGGNRTCAEVGLALYGDANYFQFSSDQVSYESGAFTGSFPAGLSVSTDGTYVTWTSTFKIGAAIVKGGNASNVYAYAPQSMGDSGLAAPPNANGKPAGLGNLTFCWNPEPVAGQWCSPGYWRQAHHLGAWTVTGYSTETKYRMAIGEQAPLKTNAKDCKTASADPSLWQVLQQPQCYGGDAFNKVADLLSTAHPDVNFTGDRVPDSCPLGRDPGT